jgi:hypothetical protein
MYKIFVKALRFCLLRLNKLFSKEIIFKNNNTRGQELSKQSMGFVSTDIHPVQSYSIPQSKKY